MNLQLKFYVKSQVGNGFNRHFYSGVNSVADCMDMAHVHEAAEFKVYNADGYFISEYALFDGKYRKVEPQCQLQKN